MNKNARNLICLLIVVAILMSFTTPAYAAIRDKDEDGYSDIAEDLSFKVKTNKYVTEAYVIERSFKCNYNNKLVGITYYDVYYSHTNRIYSDDQRVDFIGLKVRTEGNTIKLSKRILFWTTTKEYDFGISSVNVQIPNVTGMKLNSRAYSTSADDAKRQVTVGTSVGFSIAGYSIGKNNSITYDDCVCNVADNSRRSTGVDLVFNFQKYKSSLSSSYKEHILEGTDYYIAAERLYSSDVHFDQKIYITSKFVSTSGGYSSTTTCNITHTVLY